MAAKKKHDLKQHPLVEALVEKGCVPPDAVLIGGLLGKGDDAWRIYTDLELRSYVAFDPDDVLHCIDLSSKEEPLAGSAVWLRAGAQVRHVTLDSRTVAAEYLRGILSNQLAWLPSWADRLAVARTRGEEPTCRQAVTCNRANTCLRYATCGFGPTCLHADTCGVDETCRLHETCRLGETCARETTCNQDNTCDRHETCGADHTCQDHETCAHYTCDLSETCNDAETCRRHETCGDAETCLRHETCQETRRNHETCGEAETCLRHETCEQACRRSDGEEGAADIGDDAPAPRKRSANSPPGPKPRRPGKK